MQWSASRKGPFQLEVVSHGAEASFFLGKCHGLLEGRVKMRSEVVNLRM